MAAVLPVPGPPVMIRPGACGSPALSSDHNQARPASTDRSGPGTSKYNGFGSRVWPGGVLFVAGRDDIIYLLSGGTVCTVRKQSWGRGWGRGSPGYSVPALSLSWTK